MLAISLATKQYQSSAARGKRLPLIRKLVCGVTYFKQF
jgi:hypothetical protein